MSHSETNKQTLTNNVAAEKDVNASHRECSGRTKTEASGT